MVLLDSQKKIRAESILSSDRDAELHSEPQVLSAVINKMLREGVIEGPEIFPYSNPKEFASYAKKLEDAGIKIIIYTERGPCPHCERILRSMRDAMENGEVNLKIYYSVPYSKDSGGMTKQLKSQIVSAKEALATEKEKQKASAGMGPLAKMFQASKPQSPAISSSSSSSSSSSRYSLAHEEEESVAASRKPLAVPSSASEPETTYERSSPAPQSSSPSSSSSSALRGSEQVLGRGVEPLSVSSVEGAASSEQERATPDVIKRLKTATAALSGAENVGEGSASSAASSSFVPEFERKLATDRSAAEEINQNQSKLESPKAESSKRKPPPSPPKQGSP